MNQLSSILKRTIGPADSLFHEKLKSSYKAAFRRLAERLGVPIVKHKALKRPLDA